MVSVIIPARNEVYLERTVKNVLDNARGDIEVIVILDGWLPDPAIDFKDDRVQNYYFKESIGQRAAVNYGAKAAKGEFIMKLDAHCAVDEGFDVKLAADCQYNWTIVPRMYNLDAETWQPKWHKRTDYMYFTSPTAEKKFRMNYYRKQPDNDLLIDDTMCCVGACWFLRKDRYWELGGMDENHGSWGQMGIEVSCKAWLSGGALKVNKKTWFSHWFRGGGGGPGFPYPISGNAQERAREYSRDLWLNDKWPLQVHPIDWLIKKFDPPTWVDSDLTILFYSANVVSKKIMEPVVRSLKRHGYPIVSVTQEPMELGKNIVVPKERSKVNIYKQVLTAAKAAETEYVALCEDDCLYVKDHFKYRPKAPFAYNLNRWNLILSQKVYNYRKRPILSQCIAHRETLIKCLEERFENYKEEIELYTEMGRNEGSVYSYETFETEKPNLVICHNKSTFGNKLVAHDSPIEKFLPVWGDVRYWLTKFSAPQTRILRQHSHIKSIIFDMDELYDNIIEYRDRRRPIERAQERMETMVPFVKEVLAGKDFLKEDCLKHPYFEYLQSTGCNEAKSLKLMYDLINLCHDIRKNGVRNPVDMWQADGNLVIHRGWRRIIIMKELGYKKVACRVFESIDMFRKLCPDKDLKPDNSINGLAMQQFMKLQEKATDKYWVHQYTPLYDHHIGYLREEQMKLLEIGVFRGASLALWKDVFHKGKIYGIDIDDRWRELTPKEAKVFIGRQEDCKFLKEQVIPAGPFDIIIDDGGHKPGQMRASFKALWDSVAEGGWYIIEDLYGNYRPERIKESTMIMLKDMIDQMNIACDIKSMHFYYNICFIQKA